MVPCTRYEVSGTDRVYDVARRLGSPSIASMMCWYCLRCVACYHSSRICIPAQYKSVYQLEGTAGTELYVWCYQVESHGMLLLSDGIWYYQIEGIDGTELGQWR